MTVQRLARASLYGGILLAVLGLSKVHAAYVADPPYDFTGSFRFAWAIAYMVLLGVAAYGAGLPDLSRGLRSALTAGAGSAVGAALGMSVVQLIAGDALLPRFVVFGSVLVLVPWYLVCVALASGGRTHARERDRVLVVADPAEVEVLLNDLSLEPEQPALLVASLSPAEAQPETAGVPRPLIAAARASHATVVVLSRQAQADEGVVGQAAALHESGMRIRTLSLFYEQWLGKLPLYELERVSLLFDIGEVHRARYGRMKRLMDLVLGAGAVIAFVVVIPFVFIGNLFANRGPLFYIQPRIGKNNQPFEIIKFRTMRPDPSGVLHNEWTAEKDPRITPFGRLLRVTHLDELPQAVNIVRGDLSIVGPRPEQPRYVAELADKLPFYDLRHLVRPGLTGWAQVKYGYAGNEVDALEKLQYEFYYLRHQNLALDLRVVGRTVRSVLGRGGR